MSGMRFETSQGLRQGQHLALTPKLIQAAEILELPLLALRERLDRELETNVALEIVEPGDDRPLKRDLSNTRTSDSREDAPQGGGSTEFERLRRMERTYGDQWSGDGDYRPTRSGGDSDEDPKLAAMNNTAGNGASLTEQLLEQWSFSDIHDPELRAAGARIIEYISPEGMLNADLETIAQQSISIPGCDWSPAILERALLRLQHELSPPGIAASSVRECLRLQAEALLEESHTEATALVWSDALLLLETYYDDFLANRLPKICEASGMDYARIDAAKSVMRRLTTAPGFALVPPSNEPIIPDVVVELDIDANEYTVRLPDELIPRVRVSREYQELADDKTADKAARTFAGDSVRAAKTLLEAIEQRKTTLARVTRAVVARQREWFEHGPNFLRPMPMTELAEQLGIHVSTVSRAVAEKWMASPRGLVRLRDFFAGGTENSDGEDVSWNAIKAMLKQVVDAEDRKHPLSDREIAEQLKARGVEIARRTVVKYREQLSIPAATVRKVHA